MSDAADLITKLVVGSEIRIRLGTPVSTPAKEGSLQLRAMHWVPSGTEPDLMRAASHVAAVSAAPGANLTSESIAPPPAVAPPANQTDPLAARSRRQKRRALASALFLGGAALGVAFWVVVFVVLKPYVWPDKPLAVRAAVAPASAAQAPASQAQAQPEPELVKVVPTVYEPSAPALPLAPASSPQAEVPVPPQVVAAVAPPRPTTQAVAGQTPAGARPSQVASHPSKRADDPPSPAVIVDDGPPQKAQAPTGQAAAQPQPSPAAVTARATPSLDASPRAKVPNTPQRDQPRAGRLLAITPDNKAAVFTNPKSGLPEQFKVGDQLPSGETIRTISQKDGRVMTTAKEYSLE